MLQGSKITSLNFHMPASYNSFFEELNLPAVKEAELAAISVINRSPVLRSSPKKIQSQYDKVLEQLPLLVW